MKQQNSTRKSQKPIVLLLFILIATIAFSPLFRAEWLNWDDSYQVFNNPLVTGLSFKTVPELFSSFVMGMYQPLTSVLYGIEYSLWGDSALGYHMVSLLLHLFNTLLLFQILKHFTDRNDIALIAVALFAIHPVMAEPVLWISSRSTLWFSLFYLLSVNQYIKLKEHSNLKNITLVVLYGLLSMLSKASAITLPVVLLLMDLFLYRDQLKRLHPEKVILFAFSIAFGIVALHSRESWQTLTTDLENAYSLPEQLALSGGSLLLSLKNIVFPLFLSPYVAYPSPATNLTAWYILAVIAAGILVAGIIFRHKIPELLFGYLFFLIQMGLTLPMFFISRQFIADRYLYLSVGVIIFTILHFLNRKNLLAKKGTFYIASAIIAIAFVLLTRQQATYRTGSIRLWSAVIDHGHPEAQVYMLRADAYIQGNKPAEALDNYTKAIEMNPEDFMAYVNRAFLRNNMGDTEGALRDYGKALKLNPDFSKAWDARGSLLLNNKQYDKAIKHFEKAAETDPGNGDAWHHAGLAYSLKGNYANAEKQLNKAITLNDKKAHYYFDLGNALFYQQKFQQARTAYSNAINIDGNNASYFFYRGYTAAKTGDTLAGCNDMKQAQRMGHQQAKDFIQQWCKE